MKYFTGRINARPVKYPRLFSQNLSIIPFMKQTSTSERHAWDQWNWIWHVLTYSLLILHAFIARDNEIRNGPVAIILLLTACIALWYVPFGILKREVWLSQPFQTSLYFLAGWA